MNLKAFYSFTLWQKARMRGNAIRLRVSLGISNDFHASKNPTPTLPLKRGGSWIALKQAKFLRLRFLGPSSLHKLQEQFAQRSCLTGKPQGCGLCTGRPGGGFWRGGKIKKPDEILNLMTLSSLRASRGRPLFLPHSPSHRFAACIFQRF